MPDLLFWLWAVLILLGLGVILAVAIFFADKYLKVKEDERIKAVHDLLPGADCGACGYGGCLGFAEALVSGKEKRVSRCALGTAEKNFDPIIAYLNAHPNPDGTRLEVHK